MPEEQTDITLGLLNAVHENSHVTQRTVATDLGVALGLVNTYIKRCVKKGYIKVRQAPANRYAYYLTPAGFAEKSRLTAQYLSHSFNFFRRARQQCAEVLAFSEARRWRRVALAGVSELAEIMILCAHEYSVTIAGVVDPTTSRETVQNLPVVSLLKKLGPVDAIVITDLTDPQAAYAALAEHLPDERILAPALLKVVRNGGRERGMEE
ncbi:MAG: winged helix-turn-helix transcriptional regulator [Rhodospirillales bacterium]|jgi:DNA-binding MarR family transcriptional regulator|nr:winged helix-turn-helix transcriptional regulator [Rhodospirillales bacterium]